MVILPISGVTHEDQPLRFLKQLCPKAAFTGRSARVKFLPRQIFVKSGLKNGWNLGRLSIFSHPTRIFFFGETYAGWGADGTPWDNSDEDLIRVRTYSEVDQMVYPLVMTNIAIENGHLYWIYPWKMVVFHSYVSLPEGNLMPLISINCQKPWRM